MISTLFEWDFQRPQDRRAKVFELLRNSQESSGSFVGRPVVRIAGTLWDVRIRLTTTEDGKQVTTQKPVCFSALCALTAVDAGIWRDEAELILANSKEPRCESVNAL